MNIETPQGRKIRAIHLKRDAYLYIRQSTLRQVFENTESTKRQYALRERAVALGWPVERVIVIDSDLGRSGASGVDREGFQRLVAEVGMAKAGVVMGLEVSRLARNSSDWHRLLEICALTETLILDEDGIYDPAHFNDRLLLGLKGTMSEAELHILRARLIGGIFNKARRGELRSPLPVGLIYDGEGRVALDPDQQVQACLHTFFETFRRAGSASGVVKAFRKQGLLFPCRLRNGPNKGELGWRALDHSRALRVLHNPRYAGAFAYGRTRQRQLPQGGKQYKKVPRDEWLALLPNTHPGYISWETFEDNERRLRENSAAHGAERRRSPPREGPALLQGLVLCGKCGLRMTVRYHSQRGQRVPGYICQRAGIARGEPICQSMPGKTIDERIGVLLVEAVTPMALEVALSVQREFQARIDETDRLRSMAVERARYEADSAQRRYMRVDPDNRLVASTLEANWNEKLRALAEAQQEYERRREADRVALSEEQQARVLALATDFPRLWKDPATPDRERKRMVRLLLEDVTLRRDEKCIFVHVRFRGGATQSLSLPLPKPAWALRKTDPAVIAEVDRLLDDHCEAAIAELLNEQGYRSGEGLPFHVLMVQRIRHTYSLRSRYERLRATGMLTLAETAEQLHVSTTTVKTWRRAGLLKALPDSRRNDYLYEPPGADAPVRYKWKGLTQSLRRQRPATNQTDEVQYEA